MQCIRNGTKRAGCGEGSGVLQGGRGEGYISTNVTRILRGVQRRIFNHLVCMRDGDDHSRTPIAPHIVPPPPPSHKILDLQAPGIQETHQRLLVGSRDPQLGAFGLRQQGCRGVHVHQRCTPAHPTFLMHAFQARRDTDRTTLLPCLPSSAAALSHASS